MCECIQEREWFDTGSWRTLQTALRATQHAQREVANEALHFRLDHAAGRVFAMAVLESQLVPTPLENVPRAGTKQRCEVAVEGVNESLLLVAECVGIETPDGVLLALEPASPRQRRRLESLAHGHLAESRPPARDELPTVTETELHGAIRRKLAEDRATPPRMTPPPANDRETALVRDDSLPETMPPPPFGPPEARCRPAAITLPPPPSGRGFMDLPFSAEPTRDDAPRFVPPPKASSLAPNRSVRPQAAYIKTQELPDLLFANAPIGNLHHHSDVAHIEPVSGVRALPLAPSMPAPPAATVADAHAPKRTPHVALEARLLRPVMGVAVALLVAIVAVAAFSALRPSPVSTGPSLPTATR